MNFPNDQLVDELFKILNMLKCLLGYYRSEEVGTNLYGETYKNNCLREFVHSVCPDLAMQRIDFEEIDKLMQNFKHTFDYVMKEDLPAWESGEKFYNKKVPVLKHSHDMQDLGLYINSMTEIAMNLPFSVPYPAKFEDASILDFGAGNLNFLPHFEKLKVKRYIALDRMEILFGSTVVRATTDTSVFSTGNKDNLPDEQIDILWISNVIHGKKDYYTFIREEIHPLVCKYKIKCVIINDLAWSTNMAIGFNIQMKLKCGGMGLIKEHHMPANYAFMCHHRTNQYFDQTWWEVKHDS